MVQDSMDGPNVNWSLLDNLSIHRKEKNANERDLVNTGSCSLHIAHGSFSTTSKKTYWNLEASLKSFDKNFKDSPACRADYLELNGLNEMHDQMCSSYLFPMENCGHRWLENILVLNCIIKILRKIKSLFKRDKKDQILKIAKRLKQLLTMLCCPSF